MCGICGTAGFGSPEQLRAMANSLIHRGPDEEGYFERPTEALYLANRRLSIIDVEGGQQPVFSEDRSIVAIQNGEIYNFQELRAGLIAKGHTFRSHTDTEVIPHLYEEYGHAFPRYLDGMFAIALYDTQAHKLLLARDHMGIKPLYIWRGGVYAAMTIVKWVLMALLYWGTFYAFGCSLDFTVVATIPVMSSLVGYIPITVGGAGTTEWTAVALFSRVGATGATVLSVYLFMRALLLLLAFCSLLILRSRPLQSAFGTEGLVLQPGQDKRG